MREGFDARALAETATCGDMHGAWKRARGFDSPTPHNITTHHERKTGYYTDMDIADAIIERPIKFHVDKARFAYIRRRSEKRFLYAG